MYLLLLDQPTNQRPDQSVDQPNGLVLIFLRPLFFVNSPDVIQGVKEEKKCVVH